MTSAFTCVLFSFFFCSFTYRNQSGKRRPSRSGREEKGKGSWLLYIAPEGRIQQLLPKPGIMEKESMCPAFFLHSGKGFMDAWLIDKLGNHSSKCRFTMRWGIKKYTHTRGRRNVAQQCCYCPYDVKFLTRPEI